MPSVTQIDETHFVVAVSEVPEKGKANKAVLEALAEFLKIKPSAIILVSGETSREKVFSLML